MVYQIDPPKDPDARLDYVFNWNPADDPWLEDGETISSYTITAEDGITVDADSESGGVVTVWLTGGTAGTNYDVTCHVVTSVPREDDRTMRIRVQER